MSKGQDHEPAHPDLTQDKELSTWKEIASYLGVSVRTAQYWERRHGLPVGRMPGTRGRPIVHTDALLKWKEAFRDSKAQSANAPLFVTPSLNLFRPVSVFALVAMAAAAITLSYFGYADLHRKTAQPVTARLMDSELIAMGRNGKELWRRRYSPPVFQNAYSHAWPQRDTIWVGDLDGDGDSEVLASIVTSPFYEGFLGCYSNTGEERWRFRPDLSISTGARTNLSRWIPSGLAVGPTRDGGPPQIWVAFVSHDSSPTLIARISPSGHIVASYLHAGHLHVLKIWKPGPSRQTLVLAAGINNCNRSATVVGLAPDRVAGVSDESDCADEQIDGPVHNREVFRLHLPPTRLCRSLALYNGVESLQPLEGELIIETNEDLTQPLGVKPQVRYLLAQNLHISRIWFHDIYPWIHSRYLSLGLTRVPLDPREPIELGTRVRLLRPASAIAPGVPNEY